MDKLFIETKVRADESGVITGIAWPFASPDWVGDVIEKGAFASVKLPLPMLFGHDANDPIGSWTAAVEENDGLHMTGRLLVDEVSRAREVRALVAAGAVRGLSIGFVTRKAEPRPRGGRTITELELLECSLVAIPCHPGAGITSAKDAARVIRRAAELQRATALLKRKK